MLEPLGLTAEEELVYELLLARPGLTISTVSTEAGVTRARASLTLRRLEDLGLVSRDPRRSTYRAGRPEIALEALILRRKQDLERARDAARDLARRFPADAQPELGSFEIVSGAPAIAQRLSQLQLMTQRELVAIDKPPYVLQGRENVPLELSLLERGVAVRAIYDARGLELPGKMQDVATAVRAGEQARVYDETPMKMLLMDDRLALFPVPGQDGGEDLLVVGRSPLLTTLRTLFELMWKNAVPFAAGADASGWRGRISPDDERLLMLLAAGFKDQAIARQMGVGLSTVVRRMRRLMEDLGARTRFQAGLMAAERGWISVANLDAAARGAERRAATAPRAP